MQQKVLLVIAGVAALVLGVLFANGSFKTEQPINALYYDQPRALKPFTLSSSEGGEFNNVSLKGDWTLVFLGYTFCPDVCPTTLAKLNNVQPKMQVFTDNPVRVGLISVDPNRDKPERLAEYLAYFKNDAFFGASADHPSLFPFTRNLGLVYAINDEQTKESYLVDHSASVVLINPQGNIQAVFKPEYAKGVLPVIDSKKMVSDFAEIVARYQG